MKTRMKRTGLVLVVVGLLAFAFFLATDVALVPQWAQKIGWSDNQVDAARDARFGTIIGVAGSWAIILSGLWLLARRSM